VVYAIGENENLLLAYAESVEKRQER